MIIYVGHSRGEYDYIHELYEPILNSTISIEHEIIFPHYNSKEINTQDVVKQSNLFIAEVSYPSLGLGIEIGRAETIGKKILCIYKKSAKCPSSLKFVNVDILEYDDSADLIVKLQKYIENNKNI